MANKENKMSKNILIKASGDLTENKKFFDFVTKKAQDNYVVVICGGGTKISKALEDAGYAICYDECDRRITATSEERNIMRNILEQEEKRLQDKFLGSGVVVIAPILYAGSVLCPINGDDLMKAYYLGFDEGYIFTKKERVEKKQKVFSGFTKVKIMGL